MPLTFSTLKSSLEELEQKAFAELLALPEASTAISNGASGEVQFFVVQKPSEADHNEPLPVVVAIGNNYTQSKRSSLPLDHYIQTATSKTAWVEDSKLGMDMRRPLEFAWSACLRNPSSWTSGPHPAASALVSQPSTYILVVSNFSPFLTKSLWMDLKRRERDALLAMWPPLKHLNPPYCPVISPTASAGYGLLNCSSRVGSS
jgi:hypothetical protein